MHLFVYYAVPAEQRAARLERVQDLQRAVGRPSRLMRRAEAGGASETWMEIYEDVPVDFETELDAAVRQRGLADGRHVERFVDFVS